MTQMKVPAPGLTKARLTLRLPVRTRTIAEFQVLVGATVIARAISVAADVTIAEAPPAWQRLIVPGTETWFRPSSRVRFGAEFKLQCVWQRAASQLGTLPSWMTHWRPCGKDAADLATDWTDYAPNPVTKYTPSKVLSQRVASIDMESPLRDTFGVSFERLDSDSGLVHWYRHDTDCITPFVNANGPFVPAVGDYVTHVMMWIVVPLGWQDRQRVFDK